MADFFARLIQRVVPKSYTQAMAEVSICRTFMENFSGDQVGTHTVMPFKAQPHSVSTDTL